MTTTNRQPRPAAFTLVELLLATTIGALIAATAVTLLRTAAASRAKAQAHVDAAAPVRAAARMIRDDLANLHRPPQGAPTVFIGSLDENTNEQPASRVIFHALSRSPARPGRPEADVYEIEYYLQQDDDRSTLMRRLWPNPDRNASPAGILVPIAENIVAFELRYLDGEEWLPQWPEKLARVPQLITVSLVARADQNSETLVAHQFSIHPPRWPQTTANESPANAPPANEPPTNEPPTNEAPASAGDPPP